MKKKITVIGSGHVGATCALLVAQKNLGDVMILDIVEGLPQGLGLDMFEASPVLGFDSVIQGTNNYQDTAGSDIVVITAGLARKPGMTREDLLMKNADIIKNIVTQVVKYSPNAYLIIVTNPLDIMTQLAKAVSKFPKNRVVGMAGILDAARFTAFIAEELKVSVNKIEAMVLGGHGDAMVPLPSYTKVSGKPISELISKEKLDKIVQRTRDGGIEIVNLLKTGSAYYAPAASAAHMVEAILKDKKTTLPVSAYLEGEYGLKDVYIGVPAVLGKNGVEKVVELELTADEMTALKNSAEIVKENFAKLNP
jgi:malate dehydrogenase